MIYTCSTSRCCFYCIFVFYVVNVNDLQIRLVLNFLGVIFIFDEGFSKDILFELDKR